MIHKEFWGILFLIFVGWIFVPGHPTTRIEHACRPIGWSGNVVTSLTSLVLPTQQATTQRWFDKFEYGCQYTVWRLIYQEQYNTLKEAEARKTGKPAAKDKGEKSEKSDKAEVEQKASAKDAPSDSLGSTPAPPEPPVRKAAE